MLGGSRRTPERDLCCRLGDRGAQVEFILYPAPADDDEGGDERVQLGSVEVRQGLRVGEVREEAGQEGDEAVERPLGHVCTRPAAVVLLLPSSAPPASCVRSPRRRQWRRRRGTFGVGDDAVDEDVGGGIEEAEAQSVVKLHLVVDPLDLGKNGSDLIFLFEDAEVVLEVFRAVDADAAAAAG